MVTAAVLTAAGSGTRLGAAGPKALVGLAGTSLLRRAAQNLARSGVVEHLVVTVPAGAEAAFRAELAGVPGLAAADRATPGVALQVVAGGGSRQASVAAGLAVLPPEVDVVLVHDAARALAGPALVRRVAAAVRSGRRAVVPVLPLADTVKRVGPAEVDGAAPVLATVPRADLRAVQTPQGFDRALLDAAHAAGAARAGDEATAATDDAALVEALGETVWAVEGEEQAMKITTPRDLAVAEALLAREPR